jgi:flagellin
MAMVVNTNVSSLIAQSAANATNKSLDTAMERLATGKRINSAADDAAGVAIASRLEAEIRGVNQAVRNASDAQAMIDTAEGAHIEITNILQRMREIAVQSSNDSNNDTDRGYLQNEVDALANEIDRIANTSTWAGKNLIKTASSFNFLLGSEKADNEITVTTAAMTGAALGVKSGNAIVGAQGATLTEVGDNVLQVGGTPTTGDIYKMEINGQKIWVKLKVDAATPPANNFDYEYSTNEGSSYTGVVSSAADEIADKSAGSVAAILEAAIDTVVGSNHPGLVTTASTDGSVTVTQTFDDYTVTGIMDDGAADTAASQVDIAKGTGYNGVASTTSVTGAGGTVDWSAVSSGAASDVKVFKVAVPASVAAADELNLSINGNVIFADTAVSAMTGYGESIAGISRFVDEKLQAATNAEGFSFEVGFQGNDLYIKVTKTAADLIKNPATTPYASSTSLDINDQASAANAINTIDSALDLVNSQRASLGAVSNRMDSAISNLTNMSVNLAGGKSRIEDADFAAETAQLTKSQILQQAATSMLAQANASKQSVLSLLQG